MPFGPQEFRKNYILDQCQFPCLIHLDPKMKTRHASDGILEMDYK